MRAESAWGQAPLKNALVRPASVRQAPLKNALVRPAPVRQAPLKNALVRPAPVKQAPVRIGALLRFWAIGGFGLIALFWPGSAGAGEKPRPLSPVTYECLQEGSRAFGVPLQVALAVLATEGGQVGRVNPNPGSRTYDVGPMQINSTWLPILTRLTSLRPEDLRDHGCANVAVGLWILRLNLLETGDETKAIAYYHSRNPKRGQAYVAAVRSRARNLTWPKILQRANALVPNGLKP